MKLSVPLIAIGLLLASSPPVVVADIVLTDDCQEDLRTLLDQIKENRDQYTAESRARANAELTVARNPAP